MTQKLHIFKVTNHKRHSQQPVLSSTHQSTTITELIYLHSVIGIRSQLHNNKGNEKK